MNQLAVEEDCDGGGAAAHVDQGDAQLPLVLDQAGQGRGVGRHHLRRDVQVAPRDTGGEVAGHAAGGGDHVHVDAQAVAEHAARIVDAAVAVDAVADRDGVDGLAVLLVVGGLAGGLENAPEVGVADLVSGDGYLAGDEA